MKHNCKVLIVEDERMLSDVYSIVLRKNNFRVDIAYNGVEALDKLAEFRPDVILLDLLMPKMDGITFLKTLDAQQLKTTKIIVYSNLFDSDTAQTVRALGASDIVLKSSMTPDQLVELLGIHCTADV